MTSNRTEIVEGEAIAVAVELVEDRADLRVIVQQRCFGNLDDNALRCDVEMGCKCCEPDRQ